MYVIYSRYRKDIEMKECQAYGHVETSPQTQQEGQQDETDVYETV